MATEIIMPQMGFDMKEGTLVRWIKAEGDEVTKGEPVAEIETDKAVVEIEAYDSGILRKAYLSEGATVPVGQVIGIIGGADEPVPDAVPGAPAAAPVQEPPQAAPAKAEAPAPAPGQRLKASPLARREAEQRGVDISKVTGTGPGGRITRKDVVKVAQEGVAPAPPAPAPTPAPSQPAPSELVPLTRMRQAIARNMSRSKREIPHFYATVAVDMTEALRVRQQLNQALEEDVRVSINDMIIRAAALSLASHPMFNASYTDDGIQVRKQVNVGVAIALEAGLVAPGIVDCDRKSLTEIARESKGLAERARSGRLTAQEYGAATFNVTNLGMYGVESFSAIITPPQAAALAVGAVRPEAVVRDGQVVAADVMRVTLSIDHRVADGAQGGAFLSYLRALLENPVRLLL